MILENVIAHFGNQNKMAKRLGVSRQVITMWKMQNAIPSNRAIQIEKMTEGKFKAIDLPIIDDRG